MAQIRQLAELLKPELIYPEEWDINDLGLNEFDNYEKCLENFSVF